VLNYPHQTVSQNRTDESFKPLAKPSFNLSLAQVLIKGGNHASEKGNHRSEAAAK
jgi:hypothetical protein